MAEANMDVIAMMLDIGAYVVLGLIVFSMVRVIVGPSLEDRMIGLLQDCEALHLHPGNGTVYCWRARSAWRLWRRKRPLFDCLDTNPEVPLGG